MTSRWWPRIRRVWITLGISLTVVFVTWSLFAYQATSMVRESTLGNAMVSRARRVMHSVAGTTEWIMQGIHAALS